MTNQPTPEFKKDEKNNPSATDNSMDEMRDQSIQLKKYSTILGYLQYENSVYWTRSQLYLIANATLLGFVANKIPLNTEVAWLQIYTQMVLIIGGIILCCLWNRTLDSAEKWINRWIEILIKLETPIFGDIQVFRGVEQFEKKRRLYVSHIA